AAGSAASGGKGLTEIAPCNSCSIAGGQWGGGSDQFAEPAQGLGSRRGGELELGTPWAPQPEPTGPEKAFEGAEQQRDFVAGTPRLGELLGSSDGTGNLASCFVHIAWHLALW